MAFCSNCGKKIGASANFCPSCGTPVGIEEQERGQRKEVFLGEVHKCPNCGEPLKAFQSVCSACGYEFRNTQSSNAVKDFSRRLEQIEAERKPETAGGKIAMALGIGKADVTDEKVLNHIRNFNVPNTKEDVFEFMILASSNINYSALASDDSRDAGANSTKEFNAMKARSDAWVAKVEQVYHKASLSFGSDPDFGKIQDLYEKTTQSLLKAKKARTRKALRPWILLAALWIVLIIGIGGMRIAHSNRERKLEQLVQEIQTDISNGDYESALIKAQSLHMDDGWSNDSQAHWDEQRESLINLIEQKMKENN